MRSLVVLLALIASQGALPASGTSSAGDCGTAADIDEMSVQLPFRCEGTHTDEGDTYLFNMTAGQTMYVHFDTSLTEAFLFSPSQWACDESEFEECNWATYTNFGTLAFTYEANETGTWVLRLTGDHPNYTVYIATDVQSVSGTFVAPAIEQTNPRWSVARWNGPVGPSPDGAWVNLATAATGNEFVEMATDSLAQNENVQLRFFDSSLVEIPYSGCADRNLNAVQRCQAPPGAEWALVEGFLSAGFQYTVSYYH